MRFRAILAGLVAVLLLSISCVANACEISCNVKAFGPGCHTSSNATTSPAMAGMPDRGMDVSVHSARVQANDLCKHSVCEQQAQAVASDKTVLHARSLAKLQALISVLVFPVSGLHVRIESANTAPQRAPLLVALQTALRV